MTVTKTTLLFLVFCTIVFAQQNNNPGLVKTDFTDLKITREEYFDGDALWGHINGGADIFLEYGFDKLLLQEIELQNLKFKIELYKMIDAKSAFGIYSISHYKCNLRNEKIKHVCITPYQIQCAAGDYYVSIINNDGTKEEQDLSMTLFEKVFSKIKSAEFSFPEFFNQQELLSCGNKLKYFKGQLGLQNGMIDWLNRFDGLNNYEIYLLPWEREEVTANIAQIKLNSDSDAKLFLSKLGITIRPEVDYTKNNEKGLTRIVKMLSNKELIFIESNLDMKSLEKMLKLLLN